VRFVACHTCRHAVQVGGDELEIASLLNEATSFPCITPLCRGRMQAVAPAKIPGYPVLDIPVRNFFRAVHGFGLGIGDPASLKRLRELLLSQRVVDLRAEPIGQPERVILRELILESGVRLHFETSAHGACVYYIEEPGLSCVEVVENDFFANSASESGDTNREEVGRAPQTDLESSLREVSDRGVSDPARASELPDTRGVSFVPEAGFLSSGSVSGCAEPGIDKDMWLRAPD